MPNECPCGGSMLGGHRPHCGLYVAVAAAESEGEMKDDPYSTVKAILEMEARRVKSETDELYGTISRLRTALQKIAAIQPDDHGNGLRLAITIAKEAEKSIGW